MARRVHRNRNQERDHADILAYLDEYGVVDKDSIRKRNLENKKSKHARKTLGSKKKSVRRIDLHGMQSAEAETRLKNSIAQWHDMGIKEVMVIHGYGRHSDPESGPVLKNMVLELCQSHLSSYIRSFRPGKSREGGMGVTVIYLR